MSLEQYRKPAIRACRKAAARQPVQRLNIQDDTSQHPPPLPPATRRLVIAATPSFGSCGSRQSVIGQRPSTAGPRWISPIRQLSMSAQAPGCLGLDAFVIIGDAPVVLLGIYLPWRGARGGRKHTPATFEHPLRAKRPQSPSLKPGSRAMRLKSEQPMPAGLSGLVPSRASRRKGETETKKAISAVLANMSAACDLCFRKKIKCDMVQPICSNCVLYKTDCCTSIIRRKGAASKPKLPQPALRGAGSGLKP